MKARKMWGNIDDLSDALLLYKKRYVSGPFADDTQFLVQPLDPKSREEAKIAVRMALISRHPSTPSGELADAVMDALGWRKGRKKTK